MRRFACENGAIVDMKWISFRIIIIDWRWILQRFAIVFGTINNCCKIRINYTHTERLCHCTSIIDHWRRLCVNFFNLCLTFQSFSHCQHYSTHRCRRHYRDVKYITFACIHRIHSSWADDADESFGHYTSTEYRHRLVYHIAIMAVSMRWEICSKEQMTSTRMIPFIEWNF